MRVRWVKRSSLLRFEFYISPKEHWNRSAPVTPLGFIEVDVKEVADFERLAPVNVRKRTSGGSSKTTSGIEVTFSVTAIRATKILSGEPSWNESTEEKEARRVSELSLANYIISYPIPEGWELRRTTNDRVYFFNVKDSKPTATLWYNPLHGIAPRAKLKPLPPMWKRFSKNGEIWYTRTLPADSSATQALPESQDPMTFEHVLEPVQNHFPHEFFVS